MAHPLLLKSKMDDIGAATMLMFLSIIAFALCIAGRTYSKRNGHNLTKTIYTVLIILNLLSTCFYILGLLIINDHTPSN